MEAQADGQKRSVVIVDTDEGVHIGLQAVLERFGGFEIVAQGRAGDDVLALVAIHRPDVLILEPSIPQHRGTRFPRFRAPEALRQLARDYPGTGVVICSGSPLPESLAGGPLNAYVHKSEADEGQIVAAVRAAAAGERTPPRLEA